MCREPIIENPDIVTIADPKLGIFPFIHIFSVMDACGELIEYLGNASLSESQIFPASNIIIPSCVISGPECASMKLMSDRFFLTKSLGIALSNSVEFFGYS